MGPLQCAGCFHAASWKPWHGMARCYGMTQSRGIKSLSRNVKWQLQKHKLLYDFSRNIFLNPFAISSFFFFFHIMILVSSCYIIIYWKDSSVTTLIQIFWSTVFLLRGKIIDAFFPVSSLQPKKQWPWGEWLWSTLWRSVYSPVITVFVIPDYTSLVRKWIMDFWVH